MGGEEDGKPSLSKKDGMPQRAPFGAVSFQKGPSFSLEHLLGQRIIMIDEDSWAYSRQYEGYTWNSLTERRTLQVPLLEI